MPTYEYHCDKCGHIEIWQSIKDNALTSCPTCGSPVQRLISANVGFVFKGSGFYQNEYKNSPAVKAASEASAPAAAVKAPESAPKASDPAPGCGHCGGPDACSS